MQRFWIPLCVAGLLALGLFVVVEAQTVGLAGLVQPVVVDVEQAVPVVVVLALPIGESEVVTVTTPMTVNVGLRVVIEGPQVVTVTMLPADKPAVTVGAVEKEAEPAAAFVDASGIPFEVIAADGVVVEQVRSDDWGDYVSIEGIVNNGSGEELTFVSVSLELYDATGQLMSIEGAATTPRNVPTGTTFSFEGAPSGNYNDLSHYTIRID